jgi:hypothetical protein
MLISQFGLPGLLEREWVWSAEKTQISYNPKASVLIWAELQMATHIGEKM